NKYIYIYIYILFLIQFFFFIIQQFIFLIHFFFFFLQVNNYASFFGCFLFMDILAVCVYFSIKSHCFPTKEDRKGL
ncbi:hypothetical protein PFFVO_01800, partial [Plasmodium falciparum Vietnam Oak-Knoll (FVO)]